MSFFMLFLNLNAQAPGNNCASFVNLTLPAVGASITTGAQTTCGRVGDFPAGFSSVNTSYGGGEDGVYRITVPAGGGNYTFSFPASGATWKILSIHTACPPSTTNTVGGFATGGGTSGSTTLNLAAGTYFIIIDTWPTPACGGFTLNITRNVPPNPCGTAINIPSAPVTNQALSCNATAVPGALNATNVPTACGGASNNYKGGQDAIYTFTPSATGSYTISYSGQTYSAIFVYSGACPASGGTCVGSVGSTATTQSLAVTLTAGVQYFIWFDTWPAPNSPCPGTFSISAPPVACAGTPNAGTSTISSTSGCSGSSITLNATGLSTGTGISYQWQSAPAAGGPWTNITGATTASTTQTTTTGTTFYRIRTLCSSSGLSNNSNSVSYVGSSCTSTNVPTTGNNTVNCGSSTLLYDSGGSAGTYLSSSSGFTVLDNSGTGVITLSGTYSGIETCCDIIRIYSGVGTGGTLLASYTGTGTIVPITSAAGQSLTIQFASDGSVVGNGFELQAIYSGTCASCSATPSALTSSSVTTSSATISWTAASPAPSSGYQYFVSTSATAPTGATVPTGSTAAGVTSVNLTGLTANTTYYFWVRSNCGATQSNWAGSSTFFTGTPVCTNATAFGTGTAATDNSVVTINTCVYQSEYSTISGIVAGNTYSFGYNLGGWITIRTGSFNGTAVASGPAPLSWTATMSGTVYVHYNTNSACGTAAVCGTSTVACTSCSAPPSGCTNLSAFGLATAPTSNSPLTITTCVFQDDYSQIDGIVSGSTYQFGLDCGGYITIRSGTFSGPVVAMGNAPLSWTATLNGTVYVHYNTNSACGTNTVCCTNTITCTSCTAPIANDLVCNAASISCGGTVSGTTIGATNSGTGENQTCGTGQTQPGVWYVVAGNGQIMTASLCATTTWDSKISVFSGTSCAILTCVGGVDDNGPACATAAASYSWTSVVGTNYYILVHGFSSSSTFSLGLTCAPVPPADPTSITASANFVCTGSGGSVTLTANGAVGTVYWFSGSCGTTGQIGTGNSITVTPSATTTYFARNFNSGLFSNNCVSVEIELRTPPAVVAGANTAICLGSSVQLSATASDSEPNTLTVATAGINGCTGGSMFDITPVSAVTLTSFDVVPDLTGTQSVNVYYKTGTYAGSETNAAAWILLGTYSITGTADVLVNMPIASLPLAAGTTYGIYLNFNAAYTTGSTTVSDGIISVSAGAGLCGTFSLVNTPRTFNGRVNYNYNPNVILSWTPSATLSANSVLNPVATPTTTTNYLLTGTSLGCTSTSTVQVTVNANPTAAPSLTANPICNGASTTLSANAAAGSGTISTYAWSSGISGNNASGSVSTAGAYTVTVTNSNGCTATANSSALTVNALPSAAPSFTSNPICSGASTTLNANGTAGSGTLSTYAWSSGISGNNASGNVGSTGSYTVTVTNSNGCTATASSSALSLNSLPSVSASASSTTVCEGSNVTLSGSGATSYSWSGGITNGLAFAATTSTTSYNVTGTDANGCTGTGSVNLVVNTVSTIPTVTSIPGRLCPNTNSTVSAGGGTAGTGSVINWYSGPNGTGTLLGTGTSISLPFAATTTVYVRREGACNNTADVSTTIDIRAFMTISANSATTSNYCVDDFGWGHWYDSNDEIIFSAKGDFSMCPPGYPQVVVSRNNTNPFYNMSQNSTSLCASNLTPGEMRFEMGRNWNLDMGGATPSGLYSVRFYFLSSERSSVINAAADTMTNGAYANCGYSPKYNSSNNGWFWFKNVGTTYVAPQWEGVLYDGATNTTSNGVTYVEMDSIPSFSGGSGGVILVPNSTLPISWKSFTGETDNKVNYLKWITATEENTELFEVQRSADGINFETIGLVAAAGSSSSDKLYNFDDNNPIIGVNYYRLRLVELDGTTEYSNVIALEVKGDKKPYIFYPNPVTEVLTYQFTTEQEGDVIVEVMDALGRVIKSENKNSVAGSNQLFIDMSNLVSGTYSIRVRHLQSAELHSDIIIKK